MLRFIDGFDECTTGGVALKYNAFFSNFLQISMVAGRYAQQALYIQNTGFGETDLYTSFSSGISTLGFHASLNFAAPANTPIPGGVPFYRFQTGSSNVNLGIQTRADGRFDVVNRNGIIVGTSTNAAITINTWYTLECKASFGPGGSIELRLNGATILKILSADFGPANPDRCGFRWQNFGQIGPVLDDYVLYDGVAAAGDINDFTGPVQVTSILPIADAPTAWAPSSGAVCYAMVNDSPSTPGGSPDGDSTYISPTGTAAQLFQFAASPCFGLNLALAINMCARPTAGTVGLSGVCQLSGGVLTLGTVSVVPPASYQTYQVISVTNPEKGGVWIDGDINSGTFGVKYVASAQRVTAVYLEKITSLTPQPYSCGGGNYSF